MGIHFIFRTLLNSFIPYPNVSDYKGKFFDFIGDVCKQWLSENSIGAATMIKEDREKQSKKEKKVPVVDQDVIHAWVKHERQEREGGGAKK